MSGSKHDADCLRRKAEMGWLYLCTCQMTDDDVDKVHLPKAQHGQEDTSAPIPPEAQ